MAWWNIGIAAVGLAVNVAGQRQQKKAIAADANATAEQQREAAARSVAIGQRQALEERRNARLLESALQARAGGGGLDPTVVKLSSQIAGEGEYRALAALYEGESGAIGLENQATAGLRSAKARGRALDYQTAGTILDTGSKAFSTYNTRYG